MVSRQRVVLVFLQRDVDGKLLVAPRPRAAPIYGGRLSTVGGDVQAGEALEAAARRALTDELGDGIATLVRGGLSVDFTDTVKRRAICFRVHPFLAVVRGEPAEVLPGARWLDPDDLIVATALGETLPELDEALARVLDPVGALPPPFRAEGRALADDLRAPSRELAARAVALVAGGAPPERVAALRPALARLVNAARAATATARDVAAELAAAGRAEARAVEAARSAGPVELVAGEAVLPGGDVVAAAGSLQRAREARARGVAVVAHADAWATWSDELPPPLPPDLELVPATVLDRLVGASN